MTIFTIFVTILIALLPFYMRFHLKKNYSKLKEKEIREEFGVFYEDFRTDNQHRALYGFYSALR